MCRPPWSAPRSPICRRACATRRSAPVSMCPEPVRAPCAVVARRSSIASWPGPVCAAVSASCSRSPTSSAAGAGRTPGAGSSSPSRRTRAVSVSASAIWAWARASPAAASRSSPFQSASGPSPASLSVKSPASGRPVRRASSPPVSAASKSSASMRSGTCSRARREARAVSSSLRCRSRVAFTTRPASSVPSFPDRPKTARSPSTAAPTSSWSTDSDRMTTGGTEVGSSGIPSPSSARAGRRCSASRLALSSPTSSRPCSSALGEIEIRRSSTSSHGASASARRSCSRPTSNGIRPCSPVSRTLVSALLRTRLISSAMSRWPTPVWAKANTPASNRQAEASAHAEMSTVRRIM